jgi:hypothetical protein
MSHKEAQQAQKGLRTHFVPFVLLCGSLHGAKDYAS